MKKINTISFIIACVFFILTVGLVSSHAASSGIDSNGFSWSSNDDVNYTITGYSGGASSIVIPSSIDGHPVTSIGTCAFKDNKTLSSVVIPDTVTSISGFAFYYCSSLTNISIPSGVATIGDSAFAYTTSLSSITLPTNLISIGNSAFQSMYALTSIAIPSSVQTIGQYAFFECKALTSITIPNGVTTIGEGAFKDCVKLQSASMPDSVTSIGNYLFYNCRSLTDVRLSANISTITNFMFYKCWVLANISIPNSVRSFGQSAFEECSSLTSLTLPAGLTSIGIRAFVLCSALQNVVIPSSVRTIDQNAFAHCYAFTSITIPNGVTSVGDYAFYYCTSLKEITIPNSVTYLGFFTFGSNASNFVIKGNGGSYANRYALDNSITFVDLSEKNTSTSSSSATQSQSGSAATTPSQSSSVAATQSQSASASSANSTTDNNNGTTSLNSENQTTPVSSVEISTSVINANIGMVQALSVTILPDNATDKEVKWTSSDEKIATVDSAGLVTANAIGVATITAIVGDVKAICVVNVANELITLSENNKIYVSADKSILNGAIKLAIQDINDKESKQKNYGLSSENAKKYSVVYCFDAFLKDSNDENIEPNGNVMVSIHLDESMIDNAKNYLVLYIDENGNTQEITPTINGDNLLFTTSHFSRYAIVTKIPDVRTNNSIWIISSISTACILIGIACVFYRKKKKLLK